MKCSEAAQIISRGMDESLPWWQRAGLRFHLAICDACTNFSRNARLLRDAIRRLV
jgi:hypothetical protein